ncbi:hypothetical protein PV773_14280 [Mesorhizobium sp. CC13]|uniref:hypothetical protein n=1 Tax=Mesorhizobium sp. CC13 TaxID=3029194 RepID=UPI0032671371
MSKLSVNIKSSKIFGGAKCANLRKHHDELEFIGNNIRQFIIAKPKINPEFEEEFWNIGRAYGTRISRSSLLIFRCDPSGEAFGALLAIHEKAATIYIDNEIVSSIRRS